jgi:hypothetical protein
VDDEQQEAKVTSELRQLYIWKTHSSGRTESMTFLNKDTYNSVKSPIKSSQKIMD